MIEIANLKVSGLGASRVVMVVIVAPVRIISEKTPCERKLDIEAGQSLAVMISQLGLQTFDQKLWSRDTCSARREPCGSKYLVRSASPEPELDWNFVFISSIIS